MGRSWCFLVTKVFVGVSLLVGLCLSVVLGSHRPNPSEILFKSVNALWSNSLSLVSKLSSEAGKCDGNGAAESAPDCWRAASPAHALVVDTARNELVMIEGNNEVHRFPVGSASIRQGFDSPHGVFRVEKIEVCPPFYGLNPAKPIPGCDPKNPLGSGALWFLGRHYGVHGTSRPELIDERATTAESRRVSRGCFRLNNNHLSKILKQAEVGLPVWVRLGQNSQVGGGQVVVSSQAGLPTVALVRFNPGVVSVVLEHRQSGQKFRIFAPRDAKVEPARERNSDSEMQGMGVFAAYRLPLQINETNSGFRTAFQFERDASSKRLALRERD